MAPGSRTRFRSRLRWWALGIGVALGIVLGYRWHRPPATLSRYEPPRLRSNLADGPHEIIPGSGLFYLGTDTSYGYTASYAIRTSDGILVIDPGLRYATLEAAFRAVNLKSADVKQVVVTHRHADHWFAARALRDLSGARILAHADEIPYLTEAHSLPQYYTHYATPIQQIPVLDEVGALADGDILQLGDVQLEVIWTPGHTSGSLCLRGELGGYEVFFGGDVVMTLDSIQGDYMTRLGPRYGGDTGAYVKTLERLQGLPIEVVLPGHPLLGSEFLPHLGRRGWQKLLQPDIERLRRWLREYPRELTLFLDGRPKALTDQVFYLGERNATACYILRTGEGLLCVDPGDRTSEDLGRELEAFDLRLDQLELVLLTAIHPDHAAGARALCDDTGARLCCGVMPEGTPMPLQPDRQLEHLEQFTIGDTQLRALTGSPLAGADMCYLARRGDQWILFGGDSVGRFSAASRRYHANVDRRTLVHSTRDLQSIRLLAQQPVELVLPAHPEFDESPFYFPGEWLARTRAAQRK